MIGFSPVTRDGFLMLTNGETDLQPLATKLYETMPTLEWD
jgi:hypothetical protein